jgi:hypothetical protein
MPGFTDLLNNPDTLNNLFSSPAFVAGLQMLAQAGPQQGNPGFGARLGQAGLGTVQQLQEGRRQQELAQYRNNLSRMQQEQMQMAQAQQQAKADQQRQYQERLQDPAFLASLSPMARQMAQLGVDPGELIRAQNADALQQHRQASLQQDQAQFDQRQAHVGAGGSSGPRAPAPRPYIDQPIGNNQMQRYKWDASINDYAPWGEPFSQYSPGRKGKAKTGADAMTDAILNGTEPDDEPAPGQAGQALPGTAPLSSYAPQQQGPIGVLPMAAQGGGASQKPAPKAGMRVPGQAQVARPLTKEDYDALPAGSQYIDPVSGKTATKRG